MLVHLRRYSLPLQACWKTGLSIPLAIGAMALSSPSQAAILFQDNFDANTAAIGTDNNNPVAPLGWTVSNGTIDIVDHSLSGTIFYGPWPVSGKYIDLDGSTGTAGLLAKKLQLKAGGKYRLNFDLAGSYFTDTPPLNSVTINFGTFSTTIANIPRLQPFTPYTYEYTSLSTGQFDLSFQDLGGDVQGAFLDNVKVTAVAPGPLPILGTAVALRFSRRLRQRLGKL